MDGSAPPKDLLAVALVEASETPMGVALVDVARTNKRGDPQDLVTLAMQVQQADEFTRSVAGSKLSVIAEQIKFLQQQALKIMQEAKVNAYLNHAACNMVKKPGTIYHLYERDSGQKYLSIISPSEWGESCPHKFLSSHRLEYDMSWTPLDRLSDRDEEEAMVTKVLKAGRMLGPARAGDAARSDAADDGGATPLMRLMAPEIQD